MLVESIEALHDRLREYIEAVYHISNPTLIEQRRALLLRDGVLRQPAFIESTRTYARGASFADLLRDLPVEALELARRLLSQQPPLLYDPPYAHQGDALRALLHEGKDIVVYTGTGSGKTECFTVPILFRLVAEAAQDKQSFATRAVRALVLYPMNALVNDQLTRIRRLFGADEVAETFQRLAGRPVTFGQYTGRTPFSGVRSFDADHDGRRIKPFAEFYIDTVEKPIREGETKEERDGAMLLRRALVERGRWPSKPDLLGWYGKGAWAKRLHTLPGDRELVARHEFYGYRDPQGVVHGAPPDVLVTNYSMLEYMLLRPIERPIFDRTRAWLEANPNQAFFVVLDEAHLYRGAQGTEVALLIRRLRERLGLSGTGRESQLRIAVTSASFSGPDRAVEFAADLVGRATGSFVAIGGKLAATSEGEVGDAALAEALASADLQAFYNADGAQARFEAVRGALEACAGRPLEAPSSIQAIAQTAYGALVDSAVRRKLVARTQHVALQIPELAAELFPTAAKEQGERATEALASLASFARLKPDAANLLPSRIHSFHRGLPGLWACVSVTCPGGMAGSGALYAQPRDACERCESRVYELYTCRSCGAGYARAACAAPEVLAPKFLWNSAASLDPRHRDVLPVDLLLDVAKADPDLVELTSIDARTGIVVGAGAEARTVGLYRVDLARREPITTEGRLYYRCGVCGDEREEHGDPSPRTSPVEDHVTSGQDPFHALIHEQLTRQPPRPKPPAFLARETPLAGRKVLIFSDGRQKAARLAAELGRAALRDSLRPLLLKGFLARPSLKLSESYVALLVGSVQSGVDLRATDERFDLDLAKHANLTRKALADAEGGDLDLEDLRDLDVPAPVATLLVRVLRDKYTGLQALALARFVPTKKVLKRLEPLFVRPPAGIPQEHARALLTLWLGMFVEQAGATFFAEDQLEDSFKWLAAQARSGALKGVAAALKGVSAETAKDFVERWLPALKDALADANTPDGAREFCLSATKLTLEVSREDLATWGRCARCSRVQCAILPGAGCAHCGNARQVEPLAPGSPALQQFETRRGFYRKPALAALASNASALRPLAAREHSAQLTGVAGDVQSRAERHELAFQDITAPTIDGMRTPIDVLSCTTTMEVGIDIGELAAVALRNMPPGRANYQQRAGRAGRRGNAVATVIAYADQDGHNQFSFENPRRLIKAPVPDPTLNLENPRIAQRHVNAFVLQRFLADVVPATDTPPPEAANLWASLGKVSDFLTGPGPFCLSGFDVWLEHGARVAELRAAVDRWLPEEVRDRAAIVAEFPARLLDALRMALAAELAGSDGGAEGTDVDEEADGEEAPRSPSLLDRLLYEGVLPKYAFPTDLIAFHVFEATHGLRVPAADARNRVRYAPQRALPLALSEYAPGRTIFIDGRLWSSSALYSPLKGAVELAFKEARSFHTCRLCGHSRLLPDRLLPDPSGLKGKPCPSCGDPEFGSKQPAKWIRPPGFAHAVSWKPRTEPEGADYSRAGRATLWAPSPPAREWKDVADCTGVRAYLGDAREWEIIITNEGPREAGFRACRACGLIEPATQPQRDDGRPHRAPAPNQRGYNEPCVSALWESVVLGTSFKTDVLLLRFELPDGQALSPASAAFHPTLSSLSNALSLAASLSLEIEPGEVVAGYRLAFPSDGLKAAAVEVFLYDQLAGGAGYVVDLSKDLGRLFGAARAILTHGEWEERLAQEPCDRACYGCLLSFKNSYEHGVLDRFLAIDLLDAARSATPAVVAPRRRAAAYDTIARGLELLGLGAVLREPEVGGVTVPLALRTPRGRVVVPALHHPFAEGETPDDPRHGSLLDRLAGSSATRVILLNHFEVARAFPAAMERLRQACL